MPLDAAGNLDGPGTADHFDGHLGEMSLRPGTGGVFEIHVNGERIWSRKEDGGFPEIKTLKQLVRDRISPGRSLGHSDASADH